MAERVTVPITDPKGRLRPLDEVEGAVLEAAMQHVEWNATRAADELAVDRKTLYRKLKRHDINRPKGK